MRALRALTIVVLLAAAAAVAGWRPLLLLQFLRDDVREVVTLNWESLWFAHRAVVF